MPASSPGTPASLLERLRDPRDAQAWQKLVLVYTPLMRAWLRPAALQQADVDDLTQRVLEVVVRKLPQFVHNGRPGAFRTWLRGITVNVLREFGRTGKHAGRAQGTDGLLEQLEGPDSGLSAWWEQEHNRHVLNGLLSLVERDFAPTTWQAFRRVVLEELSADAVASERGMSVNAVLLAKSRVLAQLRRHAGPSGRRARAPHQSLCRLCTRHGRGGSPCQGCPQSPKLPSSISGLPSFQLAQDPRGSVEMSRFSFPY
jgi:RNA polymerase sigma-70 factor (ECF subfamily)